MIQDQQSKLSKTTLEGKQVKPLQIIGTQRSAYTHRKNRESKKIRQEMQTIHDKTKKMKEKVVAEKEENVDMTCETETVQIMLVKLPNLTLNGFATRFEVIIPEGYGLNTLRRFVYSGCKAIAINELLAIHLEAGKRCFPFDYPETEAGKDWLKHFKAEQAIHKYLSKPPSKRVNFQKLKIQYPFGNFEERTGRQV